MVMWNIESTGVRLNLEQSALPPSTSESKDPASPGSSTPTGPESPPLPVTPSHVSSPFPTSGFMLSPLSCAPTLSPMTEAAGGAGGLPPVFTDDALDAGFPAAQIHAGPPQVQEPGRPGMEEKSPVFAGDDPNYLTEVLDGAAEDTAVGADGPVTARPPVDAGEWDARSAVEQVLDRANTLQLVGSGEPDGQTTLRLVDAEYY